MLILDLWGISFHAVVVFGLGKNLLFKSILGQCGLGLIHVEGTPGPWLMRFFKSGKIRNPHEPNPHESCIISNPKCMSEGITLQL